MSVVLLRDKVEGAKEVSLEGLPSLYYVPKYITTFGKTIELKPSFNDLISEYFIQSQGGHFGYYTGHASLNLIGASTQVPFEIHIKTNNIDEDSIYTSRANKYVVSKSDIEVTEDNYLALELLDDIENLYDYFEDDVIYVISRIVTKTCLSYDNFKPYLSRFSGRTEGIIEDVFISGY